MQFTSQECKETIRGMLRQYALIYWHQMPLSHSVAQARAEQWIAERRLIG